MRYATVQDMTFFKGGEKMIDKNLAVIIAFEVAVAAGIVWGFVHEEKVKAFEQRLFRKMRRCVRKMKINFCAKTLAKEGLIVVERSKINGR